MTLTFFVETGSPSRFLICCDLCVCEIREAVGGGAQWDGGGEGREGKGCLIVYGGGVPWVLGKAAG